MSSSNDANRVRHQCDPKVCKYNCSPFGPAIQLHSIAAHIGVEPGSDLEQSVEFFLMDTEILCKKHHGNESNSQTTNKKNYMDEYMKDLRPRENALCKGLHSRQCMSIDLMRRSVEKKYDF